MENRVRTLLLAHKADEAIALLEDYRRGGGTINDALFYLLGYA